MQKMSRLDLLEMIKDMGEELKLKEYELRRLQDGTQNMGKVLYQAPAWENKELALETLCQNLQNQCARNEREIAQCVTKYDELSGQMDKMVELQQLMMELLQTDRQPAGRAAASLRTMEPSALNTQNIPTFQPRSEKQPASGSVGFAHSAADSSGIIQHTHDAANAYLQEIYDLRLEAEAEAEDIVFKAQNRADEMVLQAECRLENAKEQINAILRTAQLVKQQLSSALDGTIQ